jgi:hypothetical protein
MTSQSSAQHNGTGRAESLAWTSLEYFVQAWFPALVITILSCAIYAGIAHGVAAGFAVLGVSFAVATASGTVGWVFGLLFGIPRSLARTNVPVQLTRQPAGTQPTVTQLTPSQTTLTQPQTSATQPQATVTQPQTTAAQSTQPQSAATQSTPSETGAAQSTALETDAAQSADATAIDIQPTDSNSTAQRSAINTNLEDISDWLTKTIIGVGLTQLYAIPHAVWSYSTKLDQATLQGQGGGAVLILSLAAAASAGAFWIGYVTTRTILTKLFGLFDR